MLYNVTILHTRAGQPHGPLGKLGTWVERTRLEGEFLACWYADIGYINQTLLLHGYNDLETLHRDRDAMLLSGEMFGIPETVTGVTMRACCPLPGLAPIRPGKLGPIYEVRTYVMSLEYIAEAREAWMAALPPRSEVSKPLTAMTTSDGPAPGLIHIWPYASVDERMRIRREVIEMGIWPPKNGPRQIVSQQSDIFLPAPFSPLS